jgi:hypothetical protein
VPAANGCLLSRARHPVAALFVRVVPTSQAEFSAVANEVFQGDDVAESSFGTYPGLVVRVCGGAM